MKIYDLTLLANLRYRLAVETGHISSNSSSRGTSASSNTSPISRVISLRFQSAQIDFPHTADASTSDVREGRGIGDRGFEPACLGCAGLEFD